MKKHYRWNPLILLKNLTILAMAVLVVWGAISYCEILVKNTNLEGGAVYSEWNLLTLLIKEGE